MPIEPDRQSVPDRPLAGFLANATSFAAAAIGDAFVKLSVAALPLPQAMTMRSFFVLLLFSPQFILSARRGLPVMRTKRPWLHITRALLHFVASIATFAALQKLPLTTFTAIVFIAPVFIVLAAIPILGERVKPHQWIAIGLGFAGCMVILRPRGDGEALHMLFALGSTICWATSIAVLRLLTRTESHVTMIAWGNLPPVLLAGPIALLDWRPLDGPIWIAVIGMAGMQLAGQWFTMTALRLAPAATVAPAQFTQILWATLIGMTFFGEWPQSTVWAGAALIMASGYWLMQSERAR